MTAPRPTLIIAAARFPKPSPPVVPTIPRAVIADCLRALPVPDDGGFDELLGRLDRIDDT